ncbi:Ubiquitin-conjugating enzyme E2 [Penicillium brevicompactum]|uniref:Ubiquitin-conjugating enzyme E2 n=1 Tax=Penicillium brevicompactum TaxID=5074 RepID=UPI0025409F7C|nr:Ubiquitin-conjugating enzyme E2 [Penicillium brevicompactum]KAJ5332573.1 Ubiquitin-conjugating enzyme E2 [Penicillium brevicompactum]
MGIQPSNMRRLAADHAALHRDLPPYYLQPSEGDDLSQLTILLAGPPGTPFAQGIWKLHLKMPDDYPKSPPKATFKTRIWHPNMEELSGAVCVDTLKRDWQPNLTLRDVLVTISCLLIYPNPDSALNASAGALMQEDYAAFAHQAKLMTSIHAPIPLDLQSAATEAKLRGEEPGTKLDEHDEKSMQATQKGKRAQATSKRATRKTPSEHLPSSSRTSSHPTPPMSEDMMSEDENDQASASKENDPSLSPLPVSLAPPSPRKTALGKRPLSVLSIPYLEEDADMMLIDEDSDADIPMTSNEQNISANTRSRTSSPLRKAPKLSMLSSGINATGRFRDDMPIYEDVPQLPMADPFRRVSGDGKENHVSATRKKGALSPSKTLGATPLSPAHSRSSTPLQSSIPDISSKDPKKKSMGVHKRPVFKAKPRIGIRRL